MCDQIRAWDHARTARPVTTAHPSAAEPDEHNDMLLIRKRSSYLTISY
jgi:hypothetical protein